MKHNPLFNLIEQNFSEFKRSAKIAKEEAKSGEQFLMITLGEEKEHPELKIESVSYALKERHITVFANLEESEGNQKSAYHITTTFVAGKNILKERAYYDLHGNFLYSNWKENEDKPANIDTNAHKDIFNQRVKYTTDFQNIVSRIYNPLNKQSEKKHEQYVDALTEKSRKLIKKSSAEKKEDVADYLACIDKIIMHIEQWNIYNFIPNNQLNYFRRLKIRVQQKYSLLDNQNTPVAETKNTSSSTQIRMELKEATDSKSDVTVSSAELITKQLVDINRELKNLPANIKLLPTNKIVREHELILEKLEIVQDDDEYLDSILRLRELEKLAESELTRLLLPGSDYTRVSKVNLTITKLISIIPALRYSHFELAVKNQRYMALEILLLRRNEVSLTPPSTFTKRTISSAITLCYVDSSLNLLDECYPLNHTKIFKLLLAAGLNYSNEDEQGSTLLMKACRDGRKEEMIALLKLTGGFIRFSTDLKGFNAFGYLTMHSSNAPNLELVKLFFEHAPNYPIDHIQGIGERGSTPLIYACQKNWLDAAKLYLTYGANPAIIRMSDLNSALGLCAGKGYIPLLKLLLSESKWDLDDAYGKALLLAEKFNPEAHQILLEATKGKTYHAQDRVLAPGSSLSLSGLGFLESNREEFTLQSAGAGTSRLEIPDDLKTLLAIMERRPAARKAEVKR